MAHAQYTQTIGTAPGPTDWWELPTDNAWVGQEFRAPHGATHLRSITIWLQPSRDWNRNFWSMFYVVRDPIDPWYWVDMSRFVYSEDPFTGSGRTTVEVGNIPVRPGGLFAFFVESTADGEWEGELDYGGIQVMRRDSYAGGQLNDYATYKPDHDIRFEAEFTATPEPASMALLGTGLAGLLGAARRRRRERTEE